MNEREIIVIIILSEVRVDGAKEVEHAGLNARLHDHQIHVDLFGVRELLHDRVVVGLGDALGLCAHHFDVLAERRLE